MIIFAAFLVFHPGCKKTAVSLPDILEIAPPLREPGAAAWVDGKLVVQQVFSGEIYVLRFDPNKRELVTESKTGILCLHGDTGLYRDIGECEPALDFIESNRGLVALSLLQPIAFDYRKHGWYNDDALFKIPEGVVAGAFQDGFFHLIHPGAIYKMKEDNITSKTDASSIPPSMGLIKVKDDYYTVALGTRQLLKISVVNQKSEITGFTEPIASMPYGLAYDPEQDAFWITDPAENRVYRVSGKAFGHGSSPRLQEPSSDYKGHTVHEDISAGAVWSGEIVVTGPITVLPSASLQIKAGAHIAFVPGAGITVKGALSVEGETDRPVTMDSYKSGMWWNGIKAEPGGKLSLRDANISWAENAVWADDPESIEIVESTISKIPRDGVRLNLINSWPQKFTFERNNLENIGGTALKIVLDAVHADPPPSQWNISANTFSLNGAAIDIAPPVTRPPSERVKENSPPMFAIQAPFKVMVDHNDFFQNMFGVVHFSGDGLEFPLQTTIDGNAFIFGAFLGGAVVLDETAFSYVTSNAFLDQRFAVACRNAVVNLRETSAGKKVFSLKSNLIKATIGVQMFFRGQYHESMGNVFDTSVDHSYVYHRHYLTMNPQPPEENHSITENNYWLPQTPFFSKSLGIFREGTLVLENRGNASQPMIDATVYGTVLNGPLQDLGVGAKVDIRDPSGTPVKMAVANAAGKFVVSLAPGDYYLKAENALQWAQLKASATEVNFIILKAP